MPSGEEFEDDDTRQRRRRSERADYEQEAEDRRRPRRSSARDDDEEDERDDDEPPPRTRKRARSGLVLSVGIVEVVLASLFLFGGILGMSYGLCCAEVGPLFGEAGRPLRNDAALALKGGFFIVVAGFLMMAAGIGVMRRSNWARYLTLGVALCAPLAQVCIIILFAPGDLASGLFSVALTVGFAGFAGIVLLLPRYAAEFN